MPGLLSRVLGRANRRAPAWIEPAELEHRLRAGGPLLVLDVRGADEFSGPLGHIEGAVNLPLPELPTRLDELAADPRPVVCVCLTDKRSSQAGASLMAAGHADVAVLRGGMRGWRGSAS